MFTVYLSPANFQIRLRKSEILHLAHFDWQWMYSVFVRTMKTLIRLFVCACWFWVFVGPPCQKVCFLSCGSYVKLTLSAPKNWILKSVHPDKTAHYNPSHLDLRCCESLLTSLMAVKCSSQSDLSDHDSEGQ